MNVSFFSYFVGPFLASIWWFLFGGGSYGVLSSDISINAIVVVVVVVAIFYNPKVFCWCFQHFPDPVILGSWTGHSAPAHPRIF